MESTSLKGRKSHLETFLERWVLEMMSSNSTCMRMIQHLF